jgi:phosphatidate phosphatase APP1
MRTSDRIFLTTGPWQFFKYLRRFLDFRTSLISQTFVDQLNKQIQRVAQHYESRRPQLLGGKHDSLQ